MDQIKTRCTRRFSPGACGLTENVQPVWYFVFQKQNCTERLGCPNDERANRFQSYRACMLICRPLITIYLHMVEDYHNYDLDYLPHEDMRAKKFKRIGGRWDFIEKRKNDQIVEDYQAHDRSSMYADMTNEESLRDIDYVP